MSLVVRTSLSADSFVLFSTNSFVHLRPSYVVLFSLVFCCFYYSSPVLICQHIFSNIFIYFQYSPSRIPYLHFSTNFLVFSVNSIILDNPRQPYRPISHRRTVFSFFRPVTITKFRCMGIYKINPFLYPIYSIIKEAFLLVFFYMPNSTIFPIEKSNKRDLF